MMLGTKSQKASMMCLLTYVIMISGPAHAGNEQPPDPVSLKGFEFPESTRIGKKNIPRRGSGILTWYGFKIYTIAFYAAPNPDDLAAFDEDQSCQLSIRYYRKLKKKDLICVANECLNKRGDLDLEPLRERLDRFNDWYVNVRKGDEYRIVYRPGKGTELILNGRKLGMIPGADFARAYFDVWLSDHSPNQELRDQLLGGNPADEPAG